MKDSEKENNPMTLRSLEIEKQKWGKDAGRYTAKITYEGDKGCITLDVSPEITHDLLRFCGGAIKRFSESAANELNLSIDKSIEVANTKGKLG